MWSTRHYFKLLLSMNDIKAFKPCVAVTVSDHSSIKLRFAVSNAPVSMLSSPVSLCQITPVWSPVLLYQITPVSSPVLLCQITPVSRPVLLCQITPVSSPVLLCQITLVSSPVSLCQIHLVSSPVSLLDYSSIKPCLTVSGSSEKRKLRQHFTYQALMKTLQAAKLPAFCTENR